jgi:hypothetical protein
MHPPSAIDVDLRFDEHILGSAADRADPGRGNILKGGTGLNAAIRVAFLRIIYIVTDGAAVLDHDIVPPLSRIEAAAAYVKTRFQD